MKIITARKQGEAFTYLSNLDGYIKHGDVVHFNDILEEIEKLAEIIGGEDFAKYFRKDEKK